MSLLQDAVGYVSVQTKKEISDEKIELVNAYLDHKVSLKQVEKAAKVSRGGVYVWMHHILVEILRKQRASGINESK